ncbi:MAG: glycosyltransferase 87 family protein, partial [Candidatus Hodarchaeota archaeon]
MTEDMSGTSRILSEYGNEILLGLVLVSAVPVVLLRLFGGVMYPFFIIVFLWSVLFIGTLALVLRLIDSSQLTTLIRTESPRALPFLLLLTLIPRLIWIGDPTWISLDALWYVDFGKFMSWGDMPYADFYFPYPPMFGYFIYAISLVTLSPDAYRVLAIFCDVLIVGVLYFMSRSREKNAVLQVAPFLYAMLPFSIIESGMNGHFEPLANLFLVIALWMLLEKRITLSSAFLGLSAATKVYAGFTLPVLILVIPGVKDKIKYIAVTFTTVYLTFIPFSIPVWLRGDILWPGTAMPGLETGFFDAMFGFIFDLSPIHLLTISIVGVASIVLIVLFMMRSSGVVFTGSSVTYDILGLCVGILFVIMSYLVIVYPFIPPMPGVFWRYPTDIAFARGIATTLSSAFLLHTAWKRWRVNRKRALSNETLALLAAVTMMLLLSLSKQVFYGWYLLWAIPFLLLIKDRRLVFIIIVCMMLIYPSYTHDNFMSLGRVEERTWSDEFNNVNTWRTFIEVGDTSLTTSMISTGMRSVDGI